MWHKRNASRGLFLFFSLFYQQKEFYLFSICLRNLIDNVEEKEKKIIKKRGIWNVRHVCLVILYSTKLKPNERCFGEKMG